MGKQEYQSTITPPVLGHAVIIMDMNSNTELVNKPDSALVYKAVSKREIKTTPCLVDRLKLHLARVEVDEDLGFENRKYYLQAFTRLNMGAENPVQIFGVSMSDLSTELIEDLYELDLDTRNFALDQAIGRIFEDINPELYHNSISRVLKARLVP